MMKRLLCISLAMLLGGTAAMAQFMPSDSLRFRVSLRDKAATTYSIDRPEEFLSPKALERRAKQKLVVDSTDLPVCEAYVKQIQALGFRVQVRGKWENFVTVSCNDSSRVAELRALPFVSQVKRVSRGSLVKADKRVELAAASPRTDSLYYGDAHEQIHLNSAHLLHNAGFKGQGISVAVIDEGYHNVDIIPSMQNIRIAGTADFVYPGADIYAEGTHGLQVLSCMAMNAPGVLVGSAPEATYWLLRSEYAPTEHLVEQDYWAAAVEFADSVGVDIVNTSLGYNKFDDAEEDYELRHLDGRHSLISRQASHMLGKGMLLVCSAGNSGRGSWKKITPPADAEGVLTVGAVRRDGEVAAFSSVGNTADGRIKPDVMAVGERTALMQPDGQPGVANGTSFSTPLMAGMAACLWQALPHLTAAELLEVIRRAGDRVNYPDNIYGYGIPNLWEAYLRVLEQ